MVDNLVTPVYSNGTTLVKITKGVFNDSKNYDKFIDDITNNSTLKSDYTNHKNTYMILLFLFVIGNSAQYYYFENLRNKNAWPSHGLGGLFRKFVVHALGFYFLKSLLKYIHSSYKTNSSDFTNLGNVYGCVLIKSPFPPTDVASTTKEVIPIPYSCEKKVNEVLNNPASSDVEKHHVLNFANEIIIKMSILSDDAEKGYDKLKESFDNKYKDVVDALDDVGYIIKNISSQFQLICVAVFTVIFSNIITMKGYPIYGVSHMYNPFSCLRCTEMVGYALGMPKVMMFMDKYVNCLVGHTHYGVKSAMYVI
jgi:hypothetical protein